VTGANACYTAHAPDRSSTQSVQNRPVGLGAGFAALQDGTFQQLPHCLRRVTDINDSHETEWAELHKEFPQYFVCKTARHQRDVFEVNDDALLGIHVDEVRKLNPDGSAGDSRTVRLRLLLDDKHELLGVALLEVKISVPKRF